MIFKLNFRHDNVLAGADLAQEFMETQLGIILSVSSFTFTEMKPEQVFNHISSTFLNDQQIKNYVSVNTIYPRWRFSKMNATTFKNIPRTVFFNAYKLDRREQDEVCGTLVHEYGGHVMGFGHGNNYRQDSKEKLQSVPIFLGNKAAEWARGRNAKCG